MNDLTHEQQAAATIGLIIIIMINNNQAQADLISMISRDMANNESEYHMSDIARFAELIRLRSEIVDHLEWASSFLGSGMSLSMVIETIRTGGDQSSQLTSLYLAKIDDGWNDKRLEPELI